MVNKNLTLLAGVLLIVLFASSTSAHSWMSCPRPFITTNGRGGFTSGPCEPGASNAPINHVKAGDRLKVGWPSNNHGGGYVRLALVPEAQATDETAFAANVIKMACFGHDQRPGKYQYGDCIHPCNGRGACEYQPDTFDTERYDTTITVPTNLADGVYVLQWVGLVGNAGTPYYSCSKLQISGGNPNLACPAPSSIPSYTCLKSQSGAPSSTIMTGTAAGPFCYFSNKQGSVDDRINEVPINANCESRITCDLSVNSAVCQADFAGVADPTDPKRTDCGVIVPPPPATCSDGIQNQGEDNVDCGGIFCPACPPPPPLEGNDPALITDVKYDVSGSFSGGFSATINFVVAKPLLGGWTVTIQFGGALTSIEPWSAVFVSKNTGSNIFTFKNADWNGNVAAGSTLTFGFTAYYTGISQPNPLTYALLCTGCPSSSSGSSVVSSVQPAATSSASKPAASSSSKPAVISSSSSAAASSKPAVISSSAAPVASSSSKPSSSSSVAVPVASSSAKSTAATAAPASSASSVAAPASSSSVKLATSTPIPAPTTGNNNNNTSTGNKHIVAYYPGWATYERNYQVSSIRGDLLTHINYAFANIDSNGNCVLGDSYADTEKSFPGDTWDEPLRGNFKQLKLLKQKYPHLKTIISVGGWTWSTQFSGIALSAAKRTQFVNSCVNFMTQYGFDGIDIDWEYPVVGGDTGVPHHPTDAANYVLLLAEFRAKLNAVGPGKLLTIAAPAGFTNYIALDIPGIAASVDWINLMAYDFHGSWESVTGHNAPMDKSTQDPTTDMVSLEKLNIKSAVQGYLNTGLSKNQLVLGVPVYGRGWGGVAATNNGLFQSSSSIPRGTWENGVFDYSDLKANYLGQNGYVRYWDEQSQAAYLYSPTTRVFISYDDEQSMNVKTNYINSIDLGGAMVWDLSSDRNAVLLAVLKAGLSTPSTTPSSAPVVVASSSSNPQPASSSVKPAASSSAAPAVTTTAAASKPASSTAAAVKSSSSSAASKPSSSAAKPASSSAATQPASSSAATQPASSSAAPKPSSSSAATKPASSSSAAGKPTSSVKPFTSAAPSASSANTPCDSRCGTGVYHATGKCLPSGRCACTAAWSGPNALYISDKNEIEADYCSWACYYTASYASPSCAGNTVSSASNSGTSSSMNYATFSAQMAEKEANGQLSAPGDNNASSSNTAGLIAGVVVGIVALAVGVVAVTVSIRRHRQKSLNKHYGGSQDNILGSKGDISLEASNEKTKSDSEA